MTKTWVRRARHVLLVVPVLLGLLVATPGTAGALPKADRGGQQVTVMTRNLYLGADLVPLLADPVGNLGSVLAAVVASNPPARMAAVAQEIVASDADIVGLQEVADWTIQTGSGPVHLDFLGLLQQALAADNASYTVLVSNEDFNSHLDLGGALDAYGTYIDRDVVLVRSGLLTSVTDTETDHYSTQLTMSLTIPGLGTIPFDFERGYEWADVTIDGQPLRIVNTHPEAYSPSDFGLTGPDVNGAQAAELDAALAGDTGPTVLLGDLNSNPADPVRHGYEVLTTGSNAFTDGWKVLHPSTGYTCCRDADLMSGSLTERIDYALVRGDVRPVRDVRVGIRHELAEPRWPSDHAGVVATLSLGAE